MPRSPSCLRTLCAMRGVTLDVAAVVKRFVSNTAPVKLQAYRRELHRRKVVVCDVSPLSGHSQQLCSESSRAALTEPHRRVTSLVMGSSCSTGTLLPAIVASPGEGPAWGAAVSRWSTAIDRGSQVCEMPTLTVDPDTTNRGLLDTCERTLHVFALWTPALYEARIVCAQSSALLRSRAFFFSRVCGFTMIIWWRHSAGSWCPLGAKALQQNSKRSPTPKLCYLASGDVYVCDSTIDFFWGNMVEGTQTNQVLCYFILTNMILVA